MKGKSQVRYTSNGISKDSAVESPSQSTKQVHFQVEKQQGEDSLCTVEVDDHTITLFTRDN